MHLMLATFQACTTCNYVRKDTTEPCPKCGRGPVHSVRVCPACQGTKHVLSKEGTRNLCTTCEGRLLVPLQEAAR